MFDAEDFYDLRKQLIEQESEDGSPPPQSLYDSLEDILDFLSEAYANQDPNGELLRADDAPGYLKVECDHWRIYVPWTLAHVFPGSDIVYKLINVGAEISVNPKNYICVSGSTATLGGGTTVGDLDFCQYVDAAPASFIPEAANFQRLKRNKILISAMYGDIRIAAPWSNDRWKEIEKAASGHKSVADANRFMADFIGNIDDFGVLPISNVILSSDFANRLGSTATESYVFQENIAVDTREAGSTPPWSLIDPKQLVNYINFLTDEVNNYRDKNPVKAVKRALSLSFAVRLHDYAFEALQILRSPEAASYVSQRKNDEILESSTRYGNDVSSWINEAVNGKLYNLSEKSMNTDDLENRCCEFIDDFLDEIRRLEQL